MAPALAPARTRHSGLTVTATAGRGGTGIPSWPRSRRKRHHRSTERDHRSTRSAGSPTTTSNDDGVTAPVTRDGGSAHMGERTLRQGMHGHDVRVLQSYLCVAGFATPVDGSFGAGTTTSVVGFQSARSLKPNGVVTCADTLVLRQAVVLAMAGGATGTATINRDGTAMPHTPGS